MRGQAVSNQQRCGVGVVVRGMVSCLRVQFSSVQVKMVSKPSGGGGGGAAAHMRHTLSLRNFGFGCVCVCVNRVSKAVGGMTA